MRLKFRNKPIIVEAERLQPNRHAEDLAKWCGGTLCGFGQWLFITIKTSDEIMCAEVGDYIVKGVDGTFYVSKPSDFESIFQLA